MFGKAGSLLHFAKLQKKTTFNGSINNNSILSTFSPSTICINYFGTSSQLQRNYSNSVFHNFNSIKPNNFVTPLSSYGKRNSFLYSIFQRKLHGKRVAFKSKSEFEEEKKKKLLRAAKPKRIVTVLRAGPPESIKANNFISELRLPDHLRLIKLPPHEYFEEFITKPSLESFMALRSKILEIYSPYLDHIRALEKLINAGELVAARKYYSALITINVISPAVGVYLADNEKSKEGIKLLLDAVTIFLLESGEGTKENPFIITRMCDEFDVISALGYEFVKGEPVVIGEKFFDQVTVKPSGVEGGPEEEIWFDLTDMHLAAARMDKDIDKYASLVRT